LPGGRSILKRIIAIMLTVAFLYPKVSSATLWDRGDGLIYDDILDVTWSQDANYAATETFGIEGILDENTLSDGAMTLDAAAEWIFLLNSNEYLGFNDWRLPKALPINDSYYTYTSYTNYNGSEDGGYNITSSESPYPYSTNNEFAFMYYNSLNNMAPYDVYGNIQTGWSPTNRTFESGGSGGPVVSFDNLSTFRMYWTGNKYFDDFNWAFHFSGGYQNYEFKNLKYFVWVVRDGDVTSPVPEPSTMILLGVGIIGLTGAIRKRGPS